MLKNRSIPVLLVMVLFPALAWPQAPAVSPAVPQPVSNPAPRPAESLFSPSAAERFWEIGQDVAHADSISGPQIDQAIILLTAAKSLNRQLKGVEPLLLRLAIRHPEKDYSEQVVIWLQNYVDESADRAVVTDAIRYLLDHLNSRESRKELLDKLVSRIGNKNAAIDSDLATLLGLLMAEKGDFETAKQYLVPAYTKNKYNKAAFAKLAEIAPNEIGAGTYLEHLRLVLRENPLDLNAALNFAQYTERLQLYDVAAQSYQYCAEVFRYLYPSEPLPPHLYLPWAISCYNTQRGQHICMQIAENVRSQGQFDILLEAIAGRAAAKTGNSQEAQRIFRQAEQRAEQLLQSGVEQASATAPGGTAPVRQVNARQLAWFYCFADGNPGRALDWANKAYSAEPNAPSTSALLAYALSINNQLEWAKPLLTVAAGGQIADLVQARIAVSDGRKQDAIQTLTLAVAKDAGSLAAEQAKEMLRELGGQYAPPVDLNTLMTLLVENFGRTVVPQFVPPDKMVEIQFSIRGNEFSYGSELDGAVALTNKTAEPLVITQDSLFQGSIRVSAQVTGDIKESIPNLVSETFRTDLTIPAGKSLVRVVRLSSKELRRVLLTYPQASLEIQFTLYLDPVVTAGGAISNRLVDVKPVTVSVARPRVEITASYVRDRFNSISSGQEGQKTGTAQLFTGLLKEQYAMAEQGTLYPFKYAAWMPELLRSALLADSGLLLREGPEEWVVKVNTMACMLSLPLDQALATVVAKNLNHPQWPVRLMAVYLLAKSPGSDFGKVLDWVAQYDGSDLVRGIALSLQSASSAVPTARSSVLPPAGGTPR